MLLFNESIINIFGEIDYSTCGGNFKNPNWWEEICCEKGFTLTSLAKIQILSGKESKLAVQILGNNCKKTYIFPPYTNGHIYLIHQKIFLKWVTF